MNVLDDRWDGYISPGDYETWADLDPVGHLSLSDRVTVNLIRGNKTEELLRRLKTNPDCLSSLALPGKADFLMVYVSRFTDRQMEVLLGQLFSVYRNFGKAPETPYSLLGRMRDGSPGREGRILSGHFCLSMESLEAHFKFFPVIRDPRVSAHRAARNYPQSRYSFYITWFRKRVIFRDRERCVQVQERKKALVDRLYPLLEYSIPQTALSVIVDFTGWAEAIGERPNKPMMVRYSIQEFMLIKHCVKPRYLESLLDDYSEGRIDRYVIIDVNNMLI